MAGKATVSFDQYQEAFTELTALNKKPPTVKDLQKKLGGGSTELLGKYRAMRLLAEENTPQTLSMRPTLAKAIQAEMDDVRNVAVAALTEQLRVEREECKADFEGIELMNEERARAHAQDLDDEREKTRRASVLAEERDREIDRLRTQCIQHQEAQRVAEVQRDKAVAVCEAELVSLGRERTAHEAAWADLKVEREARHQSECAHSISREKLAVVEQRGIALQQENQRLQKTEEAAMQLPALQAVIDAQRDHISALNVMIKDMSDLDRDYQGEIHRLTQEARQSQRQCDEYKGRAEVAERMQLETLKMVDGA